MGEKDIPLTHPTDVVRTVTAHALTRWIERTGNSSEARAFANLEKHLSRADEIELAPQYQTIALLNHDLKPARYLQFNTWVFVVSMDGALLTVHTGGAKRWLQPGTKAGAKKRGSRRAR
jgi:hypothetical protein